MTFDDAWQEILDSSIPFQIPGEAGDAEVLMSNLIDIFDELREHYAPTIEMTKKEYEVFSRAKIDEDSANWLDSVEWGEVDYDYPKFMQAWLHPELIKLVEGKKK